MTGGRSSPEHQEDSGPPQETPLARQLRARFGAGPAGEHTDSGLRVDPVYLPASLTEGVADYHAKLGAPGEPPFTRGVRRGGYREGLWVMGQYSGHASPQETNNRIRSLLAQGQRGFSIALDLPTQNGLDSDHPLSEGEVGRVGVPIDSLRDMEDLLDGIPLDEVEQIRTTANAIGPIAVAMFVVAAEKHGYSPKQFRVMLQNDVLKEYVARGTYVFPPGPALQFSVDVIEYCARELPHWEPIEFCGYHIRDKGSNAVQELAIAIANGLEYIDAVTARGLHIDEFGASLYMFLSASLDIFEEVAKFRAGRRLWSTLMKERYGARLEESCAIKLFVYTLGSPLTAQEPLNNVVRTAYQALAAALGGIQTLATSSFDEAIGLPSDGAVKLSLRTQQILAYETGVTRTADPLGGSYFVEALTDELEAAVLEELSRIEDEGGALAALESGWISEQLEAEAYRLQRGIEDGSHPVVGVNYFPDDDVGDAGFSFDRVRTAVDTEKRQIDRLAEVRAQRDSANVEQGLRDLRAAAESGSNTVPSVIEAVRAYATVGEICSTLADVWGRHDNSNQSD